MNVSFFCTLNGRVCSNVHSALERSWHCHWRFLDVEQSGSLNVAKSIVGLPGTGAFHLQMGTVLTLFRLLWILFSTPMPLTLQLDRLLLSLFGVSFIPKLAASLREPSQAAAALLIKRYGPECNLPFHHGPPSGVPLYRTYIYTCVWERPRRCSRRASCL